MWSIFIVLCSLAYACNQGHGERGAIALQVGDKKISVEQVKKDIAFQTAELVDPDSTSLRLEGPLLDSLVDYYLIENYAEKHGISVSQTELLRAIGRIKKDYPDGSFEETLLRRYVSIDQWKEALRREILRKKVFEAVTIAAKPPTYQEIEHFYRAHINEFKVPQRVKFRQIATRSLQKAREALKKINKGESLADLALLYSYSPEAARGGEVGWVEKGQLDPSMDKVLFSLPVGKISPIVKSPYGYHIFQIIEVDHGGLKPLKDMAEKIQAELYTKARERAFVQWLAQQRDSTKIRVITKTLERNSSTNESG